MTTQEKAQELFNKFADIEHLGVQGNYNGTWEWSSSLWRQQAKEAAVIAVDEILNNKELLNHLDLEWWNEVKHEINKL
jgi:hypothetical protein